MIYENNLYKFPQDSASEAEKEQPEFLPADVGAKTLDSYISFRESRADSGDSFEASDYQAVRDLLTVLGPVFQKEGEVGIFAKLQEIHALLAAGESFERENITLTSEDTTTVLNAIALIELAREDKEAFLAWKNNAGDEEEEYDDDSQALAESGIVGASLGTEIALTETWKNQTRYISDEMKNLQTEVINRRLHELPHIFPPDFESIVGQFIYKLNRVTEFKPTMITEFENEFANLLEYFDLRMLRTAGEELDQELPDDPESLERIDASLNTIDEQFTNLMLLQTSPAFIAQLRNAKYRLDILRGKIKNSLATVEQSQENKQQPLAA